MQIQRRNPQFAGLGAAVKRRAAVDLAARYKVDFEKVRMIDTAVVQLHDVKVTVNGVRHTVAFDGEVGWRKSAARPDGEPCEKRGFIKIYFLGELGKIGVTELSEMFVICKIPGRHLVLFVGDRKLHPDRDMSWISACKTLVAARFDVRQVNELALELSDMQPTTPELKRVKTHVEESEEESESSESEEEEEEDEEE